jgi:hypothetical protein
MDPSLRKPVLGGDGGRHDSYARAEEGREVSEFTTKYDVELPVLRGIYKLACRGRHPTTYCRCTVVVTSRYSTAARGLLSL